MIYDHISRIAKYRGLSPLVAKAIDYITATDLTKLPLGRVDVAGDDIYAAVHEYDTKSEADSKFEGHKTYVDLQLIVSGTERMDVADIDQLTMNKPYNEKSDVWFFDRPATVQKVIVSACEFTMFMPHDVHAPTIAVDKPTPVRKVVLKIKAW
jgi:YhcH/YjgK/YiaL family protein